MIPKNSIWIWRLSNCEGGDFDKVIQKCLNSNIDCILVKAGDSVRNSQWAPDKSRVMIDKAHAAGIKIGVWAYNKPTSWQSEVKYLTECVREGVDILLIDAEQEYQDHPQRIQIAEQFMLELRKNVGNDFPIAFAPFAIPQYHANFPYYQFLKYCDAVFTQLYWAEMNFPVDKAMSLHDQGWKDFFDKHSDVKKPIFPILNSYGKGYYGALGDLTKNDLLKFMNKYSDGFSSYSYDAAFPIFWEAINEINKKEEVIVSSHTDIQLPTVVSVEQTTAAPTTAKPAASKINWNIILAFIFSLFKAIFHIR